MTFLQMACIHLNGDNDMQNVLMIKWAGFCHQQYWHEIMNVGYICILNLEFNCSVDIFIVVSLWVNFFIHSFIHSFVHFFVCSLIHSFIHSFICLFVCSFLCSLIHSIIKSFNHSIIHSWLYPRKFSVVFCN